VARTLGVDSNFGRFSRNSEMALEGLTIALFD
jgi:hypothetical protein